METSPLALDIERLQNLLVARATGGSGDHTGYRELRERLSGNPAVARLLPRFVHTCRDLEQFWGFIKQKFGTYQERREFLWGQFQPLLEAAEPGLGSPAHTTVQQALSQLDADHIQRDWAKALERRIEDPEGALTSARTLLESVCKVILDDQGEVYDENIELPKLYKQVARSLNLAPNQHVEQVFKQILKGCISVIEGLGSVRNKLGDAHGQGAKPVKPAPRHAELAVNLAGTMATFLVATYKARH